MRSSPSVNTSKTISYEVQAGVFRFIDYQRLLEGEVGYTSNEPVMLCLMSAIETGVIFLINDGIDRGLWDLQNKAERQNDILVKYRHMSRSTGILTDKKAGIIIRHFTV